MKYHAQLDQTLSKSQSTNQPTTPSSQQSIREGNFSTPKHFQEAEQNQNHTPKKCTAELKR
jgi:hypothetical protein